MDTFRVRLNCVDTYQGQPTRFDPQLRPNIKLDKAHEEPYVPIIRVFGSTETGQRVCAHIHGAFPYLYIPYGDERAIDPSSTASYINRLHLSIDRALAIANGRNLNGTKARFVARITIVKGTPFYGFNVGYKFWLKIYLLNAKDKRRLIDLLAKGAIMKRSFQCYEAHLPFHLQWMADYNLYGCGYLDVDKAYFRGPVPKLEKLEDPMHLWHDRSIPPQFLLGEAALPRVSSCALEVDIMVQDIQNRREITERNLHHDFIERLHPIPPEQKLVHSMAGLWKDEFRRRRAKMQMSGSPEDSNPFPPEVLVSMSADPRSTQGEGWVNQASYEEMIRNVIKEERDKSDGAKLSFDGYVAKIKLEPLVKTAFESIDDLYPDVLAREIRGPDLDEKDAEVDEGMVAGLAHVKEEEGEEYPEEWDEDFMKEVDLAQQGKKDALDKAKTERVGGEVKPEPEQGTSDSEEPALKKESESSESGPKNFVKPIPDQELSKTIPRVASLKRAVSDAASLNDNNKRQRMDIHDGNLYSATQPTEPKIRPEDGRPRTADGAPGNSSAPLGRTTIHGLSRRKPKSRSTTTEPTGSQKSEDQQLPFAIVKDPQNPHTLARLSQGSQPSQKLGDGLQLAQRSKLAQVLSPIISPKRVSTAIVPSPPGHSRIIKRVVQVLRNTLNIPANTTVLAFNRLPPKPTTVASTLHPSAVYQGPYYSKEEDLPEKSREWAGREFKLESTTLPFLPDFDPDASSLACVGEKPPIVWDKAKDEKENERRRRSCNLRIWEIGQTPPSFSEVEDWCKRPKATPRRKTSGSKSISPIEETKKHFSQIEGPTQKNRYGVKYTQNKKGPNAVPQAQHMSVMSLELHVNTRGKFVPNPEHDEIQCIFWCLQTDDNAPEDKIEQNKLGIIVITEDDDFAENVRRMCSKAEVHVEDCELDALNRIIDVVRLYDPDIICGFEVQNQSWGFLIERARLKYEYNLTQEFSRVNQQAHGRFSRKDDKWGFEHASSIRITGRHMFNIWRAMRAELTLTAYTLENVVFHLLHKRVPHYCWKDLTEWYTGGKLKDIQKVLDYFTDRVQYDLDILQQNELISRTSEYARLIGVDFYSIYSRGSQLKVESIMVRIAKPESLILISPTRKQVGSQNALECIPLVMEPQSNFYSSPVLVLDFQSLYPSTMIAYNFCYSTFLGRIVNWRGASKMGWIEYKRQCRLLELLKDYINITPNGMMFVKQEIRKSLLAKMLSEILETRVMVKSGMKQDPDDKALKKLLNNRQLALKLLANVTYGYTSASFSGRMPCTEIADSIVQTGRETLEKAINLIQQVPKWDAEVVYGDTDSIFVHLKGRTREQAFEIGEEIAKRITDINPRPMKLNFEKVYHPCVLLAKKRYVGFKYEKVTQLEPTFEAKGIETVRRDGTPAQQKIVEKALKILFRSQDLSQVKSYFQDQCHKIMTGRVSIQDFIIAKEVKLGTYSDKVAPPPGAMISAKKMLQDERAEPQYGERVPYVVIMGGPKGRLIDRTVAPEVLLKDEHKELDAEYYIGKSLIPPLERVFNLVGADVRSWFNSMPKTQRIRKINTDVEALGDKQMTKKTLESYMKSSSCLVCGDKMEREGAICEVCLSNKPVALLAVRSKLALMEKAYANVERICKSCSGLPWAEEVKCDSQDCPVYYTRVRERAKLGRERSVAGPIMRVLSEEGGRIEELEW